MVIEEIFKQLKMHNSKLTKKQFRPRSIVEDCRLPLSERDTVVL